MYFSIDILIQAPVLFIHYSACMLKMINPNPKDIVCPGESREATPESSQSSPRPPLPRLPPPAPSLYANVGQRSARYSNYGLNGLNPTFH